MEGYILILPYIIIMVKPLIPWFLFIFSFSSKIIADIYNFRLDILFMFLGIPQERKEMVKREISLMFLFS